MKRRNVILMLLALIFGVCATASGKAAGDWKWERKIEIICPWGAGGGADTTLRAFTSALEKVIGVPVVVNNKAGAGGVTGVEFASKQPTDGYTYVLCTPSPLLAQITGQTDYDVYGTIHPLTQLVHDVNIFVTSKDSPYSTYEELKEYCKKNPGKVKCGVMTITGLDAACVAAAWQGDVEAVAYTEGAQLNADILGGHVALGCVGPAEVSALIESGDMKAILSCTEQRLTLPKLDKVQCAGEVGLNAFFGPARGIFYIKGTPEAALKAFEAAAEKAVASKEFQNWAKEQGLDQRPGWKNTADYQAAWDKDYKDLSALFGKK
ncbi:MAG: tripartite tricarboxylate transporter substrate binding protein [Fusobacteriaceae bacterium]|jgi:tripartite-type tricarboxylate transporter receptor subunit TctC|nr:tripartite tricarboxylate transporter substrate binding protein [Fusobacteriaceae bacterium]